MVVSTATFLSTYLLDVLKQVQTVVVDEADILIARKSGKHGRKDPLFMLIKHLLEPTNFEYLSILEKRQFVFVGATMPDSLAKKSKTALPYIRSWVPDINIIKSDNVHKVVSTADIHFVDVLEGNKLKQLVSIVQNDLPNYMTTFRVLVFVNRLDTAISLHHYLTDMRTSVEIEHQDDSFPSTLLTFQQHWEDHIYSLHKNIPLQERLETFNRFVLSRQSLLVTTDVATRGLDFPDIDLVIQYDFATNAIDILHRAGRTARMGKQGKGNIIYY